MNGLAVGLPATGPTRRGMIWWNLTHMGRFSQRRIGGYNQIQRKISAISDYAEKEDLLKLVSAILTEVSKEWKWGKNT